jgi:hypothetical protein
LLLQLTRGSRRRLDALRNHNIKLQLYLEFGCSGWCDLHYAIEHRHQNYEFQLPGTAFYPRLFFIQISVSVSKSVFLPCHTYSTYLKPILSSNTARYRVVLQYFLLH